MPEPVTARGKRLLNRLNQPVDPGHPTTAQAPEPASAHAPHAVPDPEQDRRARALTKSDAHYQRRLRAAHADPDPTALLMAHVDRIRALKNPALTSAAADTLGALIDRSAT